MVLHVYVFDDDFVLRFGQHFAIRGALALEVVLINKHLIWVFMLLTKCRLCLGSKLVLADDHQVERVLLLLVQSVFYDRVDVFLARHYALEVLHGHLFFLHALIQNFAQFFIMFIRVFFQELLDFLGGEAVELARGEATRHIHLVNLLDEIKFFIAPFVWEHLGVNVSAEVQSLQRDLRRRTDVILFI